MGFNSAFKIVKNHGNGRLNNLNDPDRPQCVNILWIFIFSAPSTDWLFSGSA